MKKFYHICDPALPVARKYGRGRWNVGRCHFFQIGVGFIGSCQSTLSALPHKDTYTGVPLEMALKMTAMNSNEVYILCTENIIIDNEDDFVHNVEDALSFQNHEIPPRTWKFYEPEKENQ